jgi:hypothetical protein
MHSLPVMHRGIEAKGQDSQEEAEHDGNQPNQVFAS